MNGSGPNTYYPPNPEDIELEVDDYSKVSTGMEDAVYVDETVYSEEDDES